MRIEIVTVGTEILEGRILDANAAFLGDALTRMGHEITGIRSVADRVTAIVSALDEAMDRSQAIILTGGLGVTPDDVTRAALTQLTGRKMVTSRRELIRLQNRYRQAGKEMPDRVRDQAAYPRGAELLRNSVGQAPGILIRHRRKPIYSLPGVPFEMMAMARDELFPRFASQTPGNASLPRVLSLFGLSEAEVADRLAPLDLPVRKIRTSYLPRGHCLELVLRGPAAAADPRGRILSRALSDIRRALGDVVFADGESTLEKVVGELLTRRKLKLSVAESLTGGLIGHLLTKVPGSSNYLDRVLVTYSNRAKIQELGVPQSMIRRHGAVSAEVAQAMAEGVRRCAGAHLGIATTGIAGPSGGTKQKPVGLVYLAVAGGRGSMTKRMVIPGPRDRVKKRAALAALNELRLWLLASQRRRPAPQGRPK